MILITGMTIPTSPVLFCIHPDGKVFADLEGGWKEYQAVPISPHGRLGDLDVLAKRVEYERFHHAHTDGLAARHHVVEYGHFLKEISNTPTIIPAEESE